MLRKNFLLLSGLALACMSATSSFAQSAGPNSRNSNLMALYKCVKPDGTTTYTQKADDCPSGTRAVNPKDLGKSEGALTVGQQMALDRKIENQYSQLNMLCARVQILSARYEASKEQLGNEPSREQRSSFLRETALLKQQIDDTQASADSIAKILVMTPTCPTVNNSAIAPMLPDKPPTPPVSNPTSPPTEDAKATK